MSTPSDAWASLRLPPWRFLASRWPWAAVGYLLSSVPVGVVTLAVLGGAVLIGAVGAIVVVGILLLAEIPLLTAGLAALERRRLRLVFGGGVTGLRLREAVRAARRGPVAWGELGYAVLLAVLLWLADLVVLQLLALPIVLMLSPALMPAGNADLLGWRIDHVGEAWGAVALGLLLLPVVLYLLTAAAAAQGALARTLLVPSDEVLRAALSDLRRSRVDLVDAFEIERRRIERDLHDGVQQRLIALTMTLGRAELDLPDGPGIEEVRRARQQAEEALEDLRGTVRGIHPRVLADHGLAAAVHEIADRAAVPVTVDVRLDGRLPETVEAAAYFVVSEALSNVAKHSGAGYAEVHAWQREDRLVLTVVDDGHGGARVDGVGSGLAGLALRLEALDGDLVVSSPAGGPTEVRMECPC